MEEKYFYNEQGEFEMVPTPPMNQDSVENTTDYTANFASMDPKQLQAQRQSLSTSQGGVRSSSALKVPAKKEAPLSMSCSNCFQPFDLEQCTPYVLTCHHTACKMCLRTAHKTKTPFICSQDDVVVPVPLLKTLSKNLQVIKVLREREQVEKKKVEATTKYLEEKKEDKGELVDISAAFSGQKRKSQFEQQLKERESIGSRQSSDLKNNPAELPKDIKSLPTFMRASQSKTEGDKEFASKVAANYFPTDEEQSFRSKELQQPKPITYQPPRFPSKLPQSILESQSRAKTAAQTVQDSASQNHDNISQSTHHLPMPSTDAEAQDRITPGTKSDKGARSSYLTTQPMDIKILTGSASNRHLDTDVLTPIEEVSMSITPNSGKKKKKKGKKKKKSRNSQLGDVSSYIYYDGDSVSRMDASILSQTHRTAEPIKEEEVKELDKIKILIKEVDEGHQRSHSLDASDRKPTNHTGDLIVQKAFPDDLLEDGNQNVIVKHTSQVIEDNATATEAAATDFYELPSSMPSPEKETKPTLNDGEDSKTNDKFSFEMQPVTVSQQSNKGQTILNAKDAKIKQPLEPVEEVNQEDATQTFSRLASQVLPPQLNSLLNNNTSIDTLPQQQEKVSPSLAKKMTVDDQQLPKPEQHANTYKLDGENIELRLSNNSSVNGPLDAPQQLKSIQSFDQSTAQPANSKMLSKDTISKLNQNNQVFETDRSINLQQNQLKQQIFTPVQVQVNENLPTLQKEEVKVSQQMPIQTSQSIQPNIPQMSQSFQSLTPQFTGIIFTPSQQEQIILQYQLLQQQLKSQQQHEVEEVKDVSVNFDRATNIQQSPQLNETVMQEVPQQRFAFAPGSQVQRMSTSSYQGVQDQRGSIDRPYMEDDVAIMNMIRRYEESNPPSRTGSAFKPVNNVLSINNGLREQQFSASMPPRHPIGAFASQSFTSNYNHPVSPTVGIQRIQFQSSSKSSNLLTGNQNPNAISQQPIKFAPLPQPLPEFCTLHPGERVKYLCRSLSCMAGVCPECILGHSKHDIVAANELAAYEIKQIVRQAQRQCKKQSKRLKTARNLTDVKIDHLNTSREYEFNKLNQMFDELRKLLEQREMQLREQFNSEIKEVESRLLCDVQSIHTHYQEYVELFKDLKSLGERFTVSTDLGIISSAKSVWDLHLKTQEQVSLVSEREMQLYIIQQQMNKKILDEEDFDINNDPHQDLKIPKFDINLEKEKLILSQLCKLIKYDEMHQEDNVDQDTLIGQPIQEAQIQPQVETTLKTDPPSTIPLQQDQHPTYSHSNSLYTQQLQQLQEQINQILFLQQQQLFQTLQVQTSQQPYAPQAQNIEENNQDMIAQTTSTKEVTQGYNASNNNVNQGVSEQIQISPREYAQPPLTVMDPLKFPIDHNSNSQEPTPEQRLLAEQMQQIQEMQEQITQLQNISLLYFQQQQQNYMDDQATQAKLVAESQPNDENLVIPFEKQPIFQQQQVSYGGLEYQEKTKKSLSMIREVPEENISNPLIASHNISKEVKVASCQVDDLPILSSQQRNITLKNRKVQTKKKHTTDIFTQFDLPLSTTISTQTDTQEEQTTLSLMPQYNLMQQQHNNPALIRQLPVSVFPQQKDLPILSIQTISIIDEPMVSLNNQRQYQREVEMLELQTQTTPIHQQNTLQGSEAAPLTYELYTQTSGGTIYNNAATIQIQDQQVRQQQNMLDATLLMGDNNSAEALKKQVSCGVGEARLFRTNDISLQTEPVEKEKTFQNMSIQTARRKLGMTTRPIFDMRAETKKLPRVTSELLQTLPPLPLIQTRAESIGIQGSSLRGSSVEIPPLGQQITKKKTRKQSESNPRPRSLDLALGIFQLQIRSQVVSISKSKEQSQVGIQTELLRSLAPEPIPQLQKEITLGKTTETDAIENNDDLMFKPSNPFALKNLHWFRWDTNEVYRLNPQSRQWQMRDELRVNQKFLFFSAILHLPNEQGCFIMGGSDNDDNYSKRVQYFCKYNVFIEKPQMITRRAFFPAVFTQLDKAIYALGGSDSNTTDLNQCEKFSLAENVWRPIAPLKIPRNGASAVFFESYRLIFIFGGNSHLTGSLSSIEKYDIDFDKWTVIDIQLKKPMHDMTAMQISRDSVLIFGGHTDGEGSNREALHVDLSSECFKARHGNSALFLPEECIGGKTYFPPYLDHQTGKVQLIFGYCDQPPRIEEMDISDFTAFSSFPNSYSNIPRPQYQNYNLAGSAQQANTEESKNPNDGWQLNVMRLPPADVESSDEIIANQQAIMGASQGKTKAKGGQVAALIEKKLARKRQNSMTSNNAAKLKKAESTGYL